MKADVLEQEFQNHLRLEVTRSLGGLVRLWRQPAGKLELKRGGWVEAAPNGAADLTGIVAPTGARIELEVKGARTKVTEEQEHWRGAMLERGAVALQLRYDPEVNVEGNIVLACAEIARVARMAACVHRDEVLVGHPAGGVWCIDCGWRSGGRPREAPR